MLNSNSHEAHCRTFHISLLLPPSHTNIPLTTLLSQTFNISPSFTVTQTARNNFSCIDENMKHTQLSGSKYCLNLLFFTPTPKIMVLITFCQDLTCLKPGLQQSDSSTSQAMLHNTQTAGDITIQTVPNPFPVVQLLRE